MFVVVDCWPLGGSGSAGIFFIKISNSMVVMVQSFFREVLRLLPRHCAGPPIPYCPFGGPEPGTIGLQSVAVKLFSFKSFLVTYSARLLFHFCVADLKATQNVRNQPCTNFGRQGSTFKSKAIYFLKGYSAFLQRRQRNVKNFFVSLTLLLNSVKG